MRTVPNQRTSPPDRGDAAPDFLVQTADEPDRWLSELRGTAVVLAFHDVAWDPARTTQIEGYRNASAMADTRAILLRNDCGVADAYGVAGHSAVFVIDAQRRISWRHISGIDSLHAANAMAAELPVAGINEIGQAGDWSRREFIATAIGAAVAISLAPTVARAEVVADEVGRAGGIGDARPVALLVNGQRIVLSLEPRVTLLDALREYAGLTGTKKGCDHGQCGACTVHVGGRRVLSCLTLAIMAQDKPITTIEGLAISARADGAGLHPMQQAFIDHDGFQCGYCTPGQIMSATAMLLEPWGSADDDVREAMSGNICRCGAYPGIVAAVQVVRRNRGGQTQ